MSPSTSRLEGAPWPRTIGSWSTAGRNHRHADDEDYIMVDVGEVGNTEGIHCARDDKLRTLQQGGVVPVEVEMGVLHKQ